MNISTRQLQAFLAIARLGSFTRAAEEIFVTQAGLSLMLKDFEAQVGARLFDRTTRSVRLTPAGESLLPTARGMLADWDNATANIGQLSAVAGQQVSLAATPLIASSVLPRWLHDFRQVQPSIRVNVSDLDRRQILQGIEAGEVDLGLGAFFKPAAGIERQLLATFHMVRVSPGAGTPAPARSRGRRAGAGQRAAWSEFSGERLLALPNDNPIQKLVDAQLRELDAAPARSGALQNIQAIIAMVEAGHGVAALPGFVAPACTRYEVAVRTLVEPLVPIDFFVVSKKGRQKSELASKLIDELGKHFQKLSQINSA
ncbi:LysR family transcriptional regulator [Variovorax sp. J22G73]|jgi:DNA-binding transcriptional LysR family regulator|uniref:LysR family transcriptional regulator n=1 Tax=unclassified Variovorax TaxID=663243 RepID=UPI0025771055|nr:MULTISPECIES: LysR family transcriptional regulator [unclassified Variovorax]MDM0005402.1 LysR family transcriptional regulator [Variovorax sp. J22R203]MDM0098818.1 LysR family transcriptional regulator [Variovorax sp. J22G73]